MPVTAPSTRNQGILNGAVGRPRSVGAGLGTLLGAIATLVNTLEAELAGIVLPVLTPAAEAGNARAVAISLTTLAGAAVARTQRLHCRTYDASMVEALSAAFTLAVSGAGTAAISTSGRAALLLDTADSGLATVTVTDITGIFSGTVYLEVLPVGNVGGPGQGVIIPLAFT